MKLLVSVLSCIFFLLCSACTVQHNKLTSTQSLNTCHYLCIKKFNLCKESCLNYCQFCVKSADNSAKYAYMSYIHEEKIQGGSIDRGLQSYRDPLQCRKTSCNCYADLVVCKQSCTGIIQKRLEITPVCT